MGPPPRPAPPRPFTRTTWRVVKAEMEFPRAGPAAATAAAEGITLTETSALSGIEATRVAVGADGAPVILSPLFLVAQYVIGAGNFLEALLRRRIARMLVGMMLLGQRPKRFLDFSFARRLGDAEHFIGIFHAGLSGRGFVF